MNSQIDISDLIAKHITGILSEEEKVWLDEWLEDPYNRLQFDLITSKERIRRNRKDFEIFNPDAGWRKLDHQISGNTRIVSWVKYAAVILLPLGISLLAYMHVGDLLQEKDLLASQEYHFVEGEVELKMHNGKVYEISKDTIITSAEVNIQVDSLGMVYEHKDELGELAYNTISIPRGKQYQVRLSDGTRVWLNADTKFRYPVAFIGSKREVYLDNGEVFIEVVKNKEKPFIVHFNNHQIKVLGTRFNVKSYEDNNVDLVTLVEGSVLVGGLNSKVELVPDQQVEISKNTNHMKVNSVDATIYCAWKNQQFVYKQESLESIMNDLARFYDINVFYRNEKVKEEEFSLRLSQDDPLETILENFELTGKVQFEIKKKNIIIQ